MIVEVNNLTTNKVDEEFLKGLAKKALESQNKKMDLSIALVGQGRIRQLNKKYRQKNKATDILSFQYNGSGELVICLREVKKNAKKFKTVFQEELARVLIHGISNL